MPRRASATARSTSTSPHKKAREIDRALAALVDAGCLQRTRGHDRTTGRPTEIWIPRKHTA